MPIDEVKPPIGVPPRKIWIDARKRELARAIREYQDACLKPSPEWISELCELIQSEP